MTNKSTFENAWKKATKNIFRLEILPEYNVPEDLVIFEKWKRGQINFKEEADGWLQNLKATKARGVQMQRLRITPLPIPEYIRYEIDYWQHSIKSGEEILFLKEENFAAIKSECNFEPEDFWFFDDEVLVIFHYKKGDLVEERPVTDPAIIDTYRQMKYKLLEKAVPMEQFLDHYRNAAKNST